MNVWSLLSPQEQSHINNVYKEEKLLEEILDYKGKDIINDTVYPDDYQTFFNKAVNIKSVKCVKYLLERSTDAVIDSNFIADSFYYLIDNFSFDVADVFLKYGMDKVKDINNIAFLPKKIITCYDKGYLELTNFLIKRCNKCFLNPYWEYNCMVYFVEHGAHINNKLRYILQGYSYDIDKVNTKFDRNNFFEYELYFYERHTYDSESDEEDGMYKYTQIEINPDYYKKFQYIAQKLAKRRWTF